MLPSTTILLSGHSQLEISGQKCVMLIIALVGHTAKGCGRAYILIYVCVANPVTYLTTVNLAWDHSSKLNARLCTADKFSLTYLPPFANGTNLVSEMGFERKSSVPDNFSNLKGAVPFIEPSCAPSSTTQAQKHDHLFIYSTSWICDRAKRLNNMAGAWVDWNLCKFSF